MRALIYSNTGLTSKQIGLTGQVISDLKDQGFDLCIVCCNNILENCYANRTHNLVGCAVCQSRMHKILDLNNINNSELVSLQRFPEAYSFDIPSFDSLEEIFDFSYHDIDVGRGAASSIISYYRDYDLNTTRFGPLIELEIRKAINVLLNFEQIIQDYEPDHIYFYNGRFAEVYPLLKLAQKKTIPFFTIEAGAGSNYQLFKNALPHSIELTNQYIDATWQKGDPPSREALAVSWYEQKRSGTEQGTVIFTGLQEKGNLPERMDPDKINVAIFNSSEDELKAIAEWQTPLFKNQNDAIEKLLQMFIDLPEFHFYLRVHPNLGKLDNIQMEGIKEMSYPNLTVILPTDPVDTYQLMKACNKVITFGSSTGIEATYWEAPSILLGKSFYMLQDCVYLANSYEALLDLVKTRNLPPKPRSSTMPYGFYLSTNGYPSTHFDFQGLEKSSFKKHQLKKYYPSTLVFLFKYASNIPQWLKAFKALYRRKLSFRDFLKFN